MVYKKLPNGDFAVGSRSGNAIWIVNASITNCNCPKFKFILHGQGNCHHMQEVRKGEKNNLTTDITFNPKQYKTPLSHDAFARKYGDEQLDKLIKLQIVVIYRGIIRLLQ